MKRIWKGKGGGQFCFWWRNSILKFWFRFKQFLSSRQSRSEHFFFFFSKTSQTWNPQLSLFCLWMENCLIKINSSSLWWPLYLLFSCYGPVVVTLVCHAVGLGSIPASFSHVFLLLGLWWEEGTRYSRLVQSLVLPECSKNNKNCLLGAKTWRKCKA